MDLKNKTVAIIQARMGSTRLPGKVLMEIQGLPMIIQMVNRLKSVAEVDDVIIATTNLISDDPISQVAKSNRIPCFRGSEKDVLKRFFLASKNCKAQHIIRITGDCPLVDPQIISQLIEFYKNSSYDFCGVASGAGVANQKRIKRFPDGLDAEIFSFRVLKEAHLNASGNLYREHVTPFIWKDNKKYKVGSLYSKIDLSRLRLTVDNEEDFLFINWIYDNLYPSNKAFNLRDILQLLEEKKYKPVNAHLIGMEGYEKFWK
jgi:spore coat polysaccharide biosynthesis protein SpsF